LGRRGPEDAVGPEQVVAELEQLLLKLADVVTPDRVARFVGQYSVAEAALGAGQRGEGLDADHAVDRDGPVLLEVPYSELGGFIEHGLELGIGVVQQPERGQHAPNFDDGATSGTAAEGLHGRATPRGSGACALRRTFCPSRATIHAASQVTVSWEHRIHTRHNEAVATTGGDRFGGCWH